MVNSVWIIALQVLIQIGVIFFALRYRAVDNVPIERMARRSSHTAQALRISDAYRSRYLRSVAYAKGQCVVMARPRTAGAVFAFLTH